MKINWIGKTAFTLCGIIGLVLLAAPARVVGDGTSAASQSPWPFDQAPISTLRDSPHKVFAHYFYPFPISINNKPEDESYYTRNYLNPHGENDKFLAKGGYLRERPLPQSPSTADDWVMQNLETEVRRAAALGIDGFSIDMLSTPLPSESQGWQRQLNVFDAAEKANPGFKILLMPDMSAGFRAHPELLVDAVIQLSKYPNAYRLADGRLVVSPFNAQAQTPQWWADFEKQMADKGVPVAFIPVFLGWSKYAADYASVSYGMSDWGVRSTAVNRSWINTPKEAHKYTKIWMMPVSPQDMRPKDPIYWEAGNSADYREMWMNAINGGADWVQIITWNDYSESTEISPSTGTQWAFYDLTAYYTDWFKTGKQPKITKDVLYYFHRIVATDAYDPSIQPKATAMFPGSDPPDNEIELLAFLTKPGTISITVAGKTYQKDAPAGITSFKVPLAVGTPQFGLARGGKSVISFSSAYPIVAKTDYQDLLYRGGSSSRPPVEGAR